MISAESNHECLDFDNLKSLFKASGIKLTHQRLEIYQEVTAHASHRSAEEIHKKLQQRIPTLALDTVYRTLATFAELGIITRLTMFGDRTLFDGNPETHHHFICLRCNTIHDVFLPEFDKAPMDLTDTPIGTVSSKHIEFKGLCTRCITNLGTTAKKTITKNNN